jgi:hypothetical protein
MNRTRTAIVLAFLASLALASVAALAQQHTVTRVGIVAKPQAYNGHCPARIEFIATIHVSHPSRVEYQWERSDGGRGQRESVDIHSAGQGVTDSWTLGGGNERLVVWERLHVLAPTGISSPQARVHVNCRG